MAININREVEDTFYRYKMPRLQAKVEGKGNGIKTVIVNVSDIARALYRKPMYVIKFFGFELGAQVNIDEKNDRYIVNGDHEAHKLQQILDGFIKKFVLCQNCGNPETDLTVKKRAETVKSTCKACGASKFLDAQHRLTQYIIKNPPEASSKSKAKTKKIKGDSDDEGDENNPAAVEEDDDDDDWGEDTTEEAQRQRMEELSSMARALAVSSDVEKSKKERAQMFYTLVSSLNKEGELLQSTDKVCAEAERLDLGTRSVLLLVEVLLTDVETIIAQLKKFAPLFVKLIASSDSPEKAQLNLLNAVVTLTNEYPELLKKVVAVVKSLYDLDIVEEESILSWEEKGASSKYGSKKVHAEVLVKCAPLFTWLREAEEESSDGEEEEEEEDGPAVESEHSKEASPTQVKQNGTLANDEHVAPADEDDDIDIDAI